MKVLRCAMRTRIYGFIEMFQYGLLKDAGKVTSEIAKLHAETEFEKYRIMQDASAFKLYITALNDEECEYIKADLSEDC